MKKIFVGVATLALTLGSFSCGNKVAELKTQDDSISYAIGILQSQNLARNLEQSQNEEFEELRISNEEFLKGFNEGLKDPKKYSYYAGGITAAGMAPKLKKDELNPEMIRSAFNAVLAKDSANIQMTDSLARELMQAFQTKMQEKARLEAEAKVKAEKEKGAEFVEEFKKEEGVLTTESGLAYKVLTAGTGEMPKKEDKVKVNYKGTFIDGKEFDANDGVEFGLSQVIPGWTEMLQLMKVGEKVKVVIPSDLAYGNRGNYNIPGGSTLVFEVELVAIVK